MTEHHRDGASADPELRALLDSLGIEAEHRDVPPTRPDDDIADVARAELMLARVLAQPKRPRRRVRRRAVLLGVAALAATVLAVGWIVFTPGTTNRQTALAQTPAMLRFSQVRSGAIPTTGTPAAAQLELLAGKVRSTQPAASQPVQHLEIDAWYSSTEPAKNGARPKSVLIPTHRDSFLFPGGRLRAIERRGPALDADGTLSTLRGGWSRRPVVSDETIDTGGDRPANYPDTLPAKLSRLGRVLAPPADCAATRGGCLLSAVEDLYSNFVIDPDLAGNLWQLLAAEPSITYLGTTTDRVDRPAWAFSAASPTEGQQLIVLADPTTGQYLGYETILVAPNPTFGFTPPAVLEFSSLVRAERIARGDVPVPATAPTPS